MDVLTLLTDEHDEAKLVFRKLEKAEGAEACHLFDQLKGMLTLHEELEETFLYPQLKNDKRAKDLVLEAYQEHHVMDVLIDEISRLRPSDEAWQPKIKVLLQENTEHHIEEEEGELFPRVRKIWDTAKRDHVARQIQDMKNKRQKQRQAA